MKFLYIILFTIFLLSSCINYNKDTSPDIESIKTDTRVIKTDTGVVINIDEDKLDRRDKEDIKDKSIKIEDDTLDRDRTATEIFENTKIPDGYVIPSNELFIFNKIIENDIEYFNSNNDEKIVYDIFRSYIFGEKTYDKELKKLVSCLNGNIKPNNILNEEFKNICIGKNTYLYDVDFNYFHIKDTLIKYKKIFNGEKFNCNYFLKDNYDYDFRYLYDSNEDNIDTFEVFSLYIKKSDYFTCKKLEDINNYDIDKKFFFYHTAKDLNKCELLDDENLVNFCNDEIKSSIK